jgi:hypothetical protein
MSQLARKSELNPELGAVMKAIRALGLEPHGATVA